MATPSRTFKLESWMGTLDGFWTLPPQCSYITEAQTTIYQIVALSSGSSTASVETRDYRNNITAWQTPDCLPTNWLPGTANYYYPANCPTGWTEWVMRTNIIEVSTTTVGKPAVADPSRLVPFTETMRYNRPMIDMACCPASYDTTWLGTDIFCTRSITQSSLYPINTWYLWSTQGHNTSSSSFNTGNVTDVATINQILTYIPLFARTYNGYGAGFTPTKIAANFTITTQTYDDGFTAPIRGTSAATSTTATKNPSNLIIGITVPASVIFLTICGYIFWYVRYYKKRSTQTSDGSSEEDGVTPTDMHKAELPGSRPQFDLTYPLIEKAELPGKLEERGSGSLNMTPRDGDDDLNRVPQLDEQVGRRGDADIELDHQSGRRGVAETEVDGVQQERLVTGGGASNLLMHVIPRKEVPLRPRTTLGAYETVPQQSPGSEDGLGSPADSTTMPASVALLSPPDDDEAAKAEKKLQRKEQMLKERREQLAREEEALRRQRAERSGGT